MTCLYASPFIIRKYFREKSLPYSKFVLILEVISHLLIGRAQNRDWSTLHHRGLAHLFLANSQDGHSFYNTNHSDTPFTLFGIAGPSSLTHGSLFPFVWPWLQMKRFLVSCYGIIVMPTTHRQRWVAKRKRRSFIKRFMKLVPACGKAVGSCERQTIQNCKKIRLTLVILIAACLSIWRDSLQQIFQSGQQHSSQHAMRSKC